MGASVWRTYTDRFQFERREEAQSDSAQALLAVLRQLELASSRRWLRKDGTWTYAVASPCITRVIRCGFRSSAPAPSPSQLRAATMQRLHESSEEYALGWTVDEVGHQHSGSGGTFLAFPLLRAEHNRAEHNRAYAFATNACGDSTGDETVSQVHLASDTLRELVTEFEPQ